MKKINRVKRNEDFSRIIQKKQVVSSTSFVVYYLKNNLDYLRIGISVGKKMGNAVERNKIKRQIRSMLRESVDFAQSYDLIVISKVNYNNHIYIDNEKDLLHLLKKIKIEEQSLLIRKEI